MSLWRWPLLLAAIYAAAVVDTALADVAAIGPIVPAALPLLGIVWALMVDDSYAVLGAAVAGLGADLLTPGRVGPGAFWLILTSLAAVRLRRAWPLEHWLWPAAFTALGLAGWAVLTGLTRWLLGEVPLAPGLIVQRALLTGLYSGVFALPCWIVAGWLREPRARPDDDRRLLLSP